MGGEWEEEGRGCRFRGALRQGRQGSGLGATGFEPQLCVRPRPIHLSGLSRMMLIVLMPRDLASWSISCSAAEVVVAMAGGCVRVWVGGGGARGGAEDEEQMWWWVLSRAAWARGGTRIPRQAPPRCCRQTPTPSAAHHCVVLKHTMQRSREAWRQYGAHLAHVAGGAALHQRVARGQRHILLQQAHRGRGAATAATALAAAAGSGRFECEGAGG